MILVLAPGIPTRLKWNVAEHIKANWLPPEHYNGNLDGYLFQYWLASNLSNNVSDSVKTTIFTKENQVQISLPVCENNEEIIFYWIQISAFNLIEEKKLFGPAFTNKVDICKFQIKG